MVEEIKYDRLPDRLKLRFEPRRAEIADMDALLDILEQAKAYLRESGVDQWQEGYPNREALAADIEAGRGWLFECVDNGEIAGYECVAMTPEVCYREIDGAWLTEGENYAVIHRAMAAARYRGTRLAAEMFSFAAELAAGMGRLSVRVDTHRDNKAMNRLCEKQGFTYCGVVDLGLVDPASDSLRNAYEKLL